MDIDDRLKQMLDELRAERDRMKVQIHLGKAEAKQEWEQMEVKWG